LADFNKQGKIHSSNIQLLLKYIPCSTEFSQKSYIKQINEIMSIFFKELNQTELNLELYEKYIEDYTKKSEKQNEIINSDFIYNYENNAPFFYFISIASYLFKHLPFNPKFVEKFQYQKKITKIKLGNINGYQSRRSQKLLSTDIKKNILKNISNSKFNSTFRMNANISTNNRFSYNPNDLTIKEALPKIGRTNLFNIKKSSSQIFLKKENLNKAISNIDLNKNQLNRNKRAPSINKHEYIVAKKKEESSKINSQHERSFVDNNLIKKIKKKKKVEKSEHSNEDDELPIPTIKKKKKVLLNRIVENESDKDKNKDENNKKSDGENNNMNNHVNNHVNNHIQEEEINTDIKDNNIIKDEI
jgi:hypothetical protein